MLCTKNVYRLFTGMFIFLIGYGITGCRSSSDQSSLPTTDKAENKAQTQSPLSEPNTRTTQRTVPDKVYEVWDYIQKYDRAPEGYVGGRKFGNFERHLPQTTPSGRRIQYREWDVNPKKEGKNRGAERLVTGSDGRAWYTRDHYNSFTEVLY